MKELMKVKYHSSKVIYLELYPREMMSKAGGKQVY
jgi:hypothetical protein